MAVRFWILSRFLCCAGVLALSVFQCWGQHSTLTYDKQHCRNLSLHIGPSSWIFSLPKNDLSSPRAHCKCHTLEVIGLTLDHILSYYQCFKMRKITCQVYFTSSYIQSHLYTTPCDVISKPLFFSVSQLSINNVYVSMDEIHSNYNPFLFTFGLKYILQHSLIIIGIISYTFMAPFINLHSCITMPMECYLSQKLDLVLGFFVCLFILLIDYLFLHTIYQEKGRMIIVLCYCLPRFTKTVTCSVHINISLQHSTVCCLAAVSANSSVKPSWQWHHQKLRVANHWWSLALS